MTSRALWLIALGGCWGTTTPTPPVVERDPPPPRIGPPPVAQRPVAPAKRAVLETRFGTGVGGNLIDTTSLPRVTGTAFSWRIHLPCTDATVELREVMRAPSPTSWGSGSIIVTDGGMTAEHTVTVPCVDGWIENTWFLNQTDPVGAWTIVVDVAGFRPVEFHFDVVTP